MFGGVRISSLLQEDVNCLRHEFGSHHVILEFHVFQRYKHRNRVKAGNISRHKEINPMSLAIQMACLPGDFGLQTLRNRGSN